MKESFETGTVQDFLGLTDVEHVLVDVRAYLALGVRRGRQQKAMTQEELATAANTTQTRISKAENGNPDVSIELYLRMLLALGVEKQTITKTFSVFAGFGETNDQSQKDQQENNSTG